MEHLVRWHFTCICVQRTLCLLDLIDKLTQLHHLRATVVRELVTAGVIAMQRIASPPPTDRQTQREKLLVVRFLDAHLAQGGIEQHGYDIIYRMVTLISAIGQELHSIIQSHIAHISTLRRIEWYADCVLEGCEVFRKHFELRLKNAQSAAQQLPNLQGVKEEDLSEALHKWRTRSRYVVELSLSFMPVSTDGGNRDLHEPTGNDARLFRHVTNHFDERIYQHFLQLRRRKPDSRAVGLNEHVEAMQQALESICDICNAADQIVADLDNEHDTAAKRLKYWARKKLKPIITQLPVARTPVLGEVSGVLETIPSVDLADARDQYSERNKQRRVSRPPQLPPLPFQTDAQEDVASVPRPEPLRVTREISHSSFNKSFSAIEEQVTHRGHFRNVTAADDSYTAEPYSAGIGLGILQPRPQRSLNGPAAGVRRKGSASNVPRVFTGSFSELENKVLHYKLHQIKTPEAQPTPPEMSGNVSPEEGTVVRDFADPAQTPRMCPSPVTLLQRREALFSRDVQWESRVVNGEVVRSRRPGDKLQRAQTIDDSTGGLEAWLSQQVAVEQPSPDTAKSAVTRRMIRHRENTL